MKIKKALIVVDVQNDFCPGGLYPVPQGDKVVKPINKLLSFARKQGWFIAFSRDWHPINMVGSRHCIQNTEGAKYHHELAINYDDIIISKGKDLSNKHYSAFNGDDIKLNNLLHQNKIKEVYVVGLALDYCVLETAHDSIKNDYKTYIVQDASRGIFIKMSKKQFVEDLKKTGIRLINSNFIIV